MNRLSLPRIIKNTYRKERLSSLLILAGTIDLLIGGFNERATLIAFGLVIVLGSIAWRWLQMQPIQSTSVNQTVPSNTNRRYLPPASSRIPLPLLTNNEKSPPKTKY